MRPESTEITEIKTNKLNIVQKIRAWLRAVDEAVSYDPIEQMQRRIDLLEEKLRRLV